MRGKKGTGKKREPKERMLSVTGLGKMLDDVCARLERNDPKLLELLAGMRKKNSVREREQTAVSAFDVHELAGPTMGIM